MKKKMFDADFRYETVYFWMQVLMNNYEKVENEHAEIKKLFTFWSDFYLRKQEVFVQESNTILHVMKNSAAL